MNKIEENLLSSEIMHNIQVKKYEATKIWIPKQETPNKAEEVEEEESEYQYKKGTKEQAKTQKHKMMSSKQMIKSYKQKILGLREKTSKLLNNKGNPQDGNELSERSNRVVDTHRSSSNWKEKPTRSKTQTRKSKVNKAKLQLMDFPGTTMHNKFKAI